MRIISDHTDLIKSRTAIVRCNFDVPLKNGQIQDTTRLESALPTLKFLLQHQVSLILLAHQDRPDGQYQSQNSLKPLLPFFQSALNLPLTFIDYQSSFTQLKPHPTPTSPCLVDNLRFYPQEEANDTAFATHLASLGDIYINEAFANCHRSHASIVGIPSHLPSFAGLSLAHEIKTINQVKHQPQHPLVIIIGGSKLETKEPLVTAFANQAEHILVGGKLAFDLKQHPQLLSPKVILADLLPDGKDITPTSAQQFASIIANAGTIIWNGTMGIFEDPAYQTGTRIVAQAVHQSPAFTLVGGGDTEAALTKLDLESNIDHISTGGGAMLTLLSTSSLVGIEALNS